MNEPLVQGDKNVVGGGVSTGVLGECFLVAERSKVSARWGGTPLPHHP